MTTATAVPGLRVYKFGGASVKDAAGILNVCRIVQETALGQPLLIVVSAMGKTTNALEEILWLGYSEQDYAEPMQALRAYHAAAAEALALPEPQAIEEAFYAITQQLQRPEDTAEYDELYDQLVSQGEAMSASLLSAALGQALGAEAVRYVPVATLIRTDETWREGKVDWLETERLIQQAVTAAFASGAQVIVTEGFIGGTADGRTTTLGREGSDYSAAIFAYCLGAENVTIWKDVPGLLNADPKFFPDTVLYPEISYQETIEMAYYGASVIHPKTLQPLAERGIPLYVKSFLDPRAPGTLIHDCRHPALAPAFIRKGGQCLLSFQSKDFAFISEENLAVIFGALAAARLKINVMQNSAISFSVATDYHAGRVQRALAALGGQFSAHYNAGLTLFTIKNYDQASLERLTAGRALLLEQRTRSTFQFLVRE
ncbi:MAG: aspartate kinase [Janthinobacterium lividum]